VIGYVEYGYAKSQNLPFALLENKAGAFVAATSMSGQAALAGAQLPDNLIAWVSDPEGKDAYPIVTYTWVMLYKKYGDKRKLDTLKELFTLAEGFLGQAVYRQLRALGLERRPGLARLPDLVEETLKNLIHLLAAIPSVVYGLWGLFVVIPVIRPACNWLHLKMGWLPLFGTDLAGPGVLPAVIVLSIMILPTITAIATDALLAVPSKLRMAAYGLGATRWETIIGVILPTAARGIFGGVVLAFGRALGETMALAMLVGNANQINVSLFSPANTLAALLANSFPEAGPKQVPVLMYAALVLLAMTLVVNILGALLLQRASAATKGAR